MNSSLLKTQALCWLRYVKYFDYICTEGGYWSADVIAATEKMAIEVEVKISIADLNAEFRNKMAKHAYYNNGVPRWSPNYFYFLIPVELQEKALPIIKEKFPKAGLLVFDEIQVSCVHKATKLHKEKPSKQLMHSILRRMGSELCGLHVALDKLRHKGAKIEQIEELKKAVVDALVEKTGLEEWEKDDEDKPVQDSNRS